MSHYYNFHLKPSFSLICLDRFKDKIYMYCGFLFVIIYMLAIR